MSASNAVVDGWTSWNGDDIINVAPPAMNVTMRNIIAYGTHGVSVSCSGGTGGDYLFENALIYDSLIGARFKGVLGTTCNVLNVTWRNFAIFNTSYPVHFIENYVDQETGPPKNANLSLAAFATNFVWDNIVATTAEVLADGSCISDPCWSFTPGESAENGLYLLCRDQAHCKDFHLSHITLLGAVSKTRSFLRPSLIYTMPQVRSAPLLMQDLATQDGGPGQMDCTGLEGVKGMGYACNNSTLQEA